MEKKMEKMKKEIKTQNRFYLIIAALFSNCTVYQHLRCTDLCLHKSALCRICAWVCTWSGYRRGNFCNTAVL